MKILLVTPAPPSSRKGNRVTAVRWARLLRQLGHRVAIKQEYTGGSWDALVALHARRSAQAVQSFRRDQPNGPVVLALTGTDLYEEIRTSKVAQETLESATRIVLLQPLGMAELPPHLQAKARAIYQSAEVPRSEGPRSDRFQVCVLGHLREVKDPLRTAKAARLLRPDSRVQVVHLGAALSANLADEARAEMAENPRYRWLGDVPRPRALRTLARSRLLVLTSRLEGGANVVSEALAASVPVLSSRIAGSIGILGADYPGYFRVGDTAALAALLERAETDSSFYRDLKRRCRKLKILVSPSRERREWARLLRELLPAKAVKGA